MLDNLNLEDLLEWIIVDSKGLSLLSVGEEGWSFVIYYWEGDCVIRSDEFIKESAPRVIESSI